MVRRTPEVTDDPRCKKPARRCSAGPGGGKQFSNADNTPAIPAGAMAPMPPAKKGIKAWMPISLIEVGWWLEGFNNYAVAWRENFALKWSDAEITGNSRFGASVLLLKLPNGEYLAMSIRGYKPHDRNRVSLEDLRWAGRFRL